MMKTSNKCVLTACVTEIIWKTVLNYTLKGLVMSIDFAFYVLPGCQKY